MSRGADKAAVANFLASVSDLSVQDAYANLRQDARDYGWNEATRTAIANGISAHLSLRKVVVERPGPIACCEACGFQAFRVEELGVPAGQPPAEWNVAGELVQGFLCPAFDCGAWVDVVLGEATGIDGAAAERAVA